MPLRVFGAAILGCLLCGIPAAATPDNSHTATTEGALAAADQLLRAGKFAEAESSYAALIDRDPNLIAAQVGHIRAMLYQQNIDGSFELASKAVASHPD